MNIYRKAAIKLLGASMILLASSFGLFASGTLTVNPNSVNFGKQTVGSVSTAAAVVLTNSSRSQVTISKLSLPSEFSIAGPSLPLKLSEGSSASFTVTFTPAAAKAYKSQLEFIETTGFDVSVALSGSGVAAAAAASAPAPAPAKLTSSTSLLSFSSVNVGSSSTLTATLTNTGGQSLSISGVSLSGPGLSLSGISTGTILEAGQAATLDLVFSPAASGAVSGSVTITSNASDPSLVISVSGTGAQAAASYSVALDWNADSGATSGYDVFRSTVSGSSYVQLTSSPVTATTYTDPTVQAGDTYYYVITAVGSSSTQSSYSNQATVAIP